MPARPLNKRRLLVVPAAVAAVLAIVAPAWAHVSVSSPDAAPGGFGKVVFRVPTESATASTTQVSVDLPTTTPFAFVSAQPKPGWRITMRQTKLAKPISAEGFNLTKATTRVTWTAAKGHGLAPGEFDEFALSVGPFPKKATPIVMPATQTYSDGSTVHWNQPTPASGKEPEHPAPTLTFAAPASPAARGAHDSDSLARWLGGGGLLLGAAALVVALAGRRRAGASA